MPSMEFSSYDLISAMCAEIQRFHSEIIYKANRPDFWVFILTGLFGVYVFRITDQNQNILKIRLNQVQKIKIQVSHHHILGTWHHVKLIQRNHFSRGVNQTLEIYGNPFEKSEISYIKCWSDLPYSYKISRG